MPMYKLNVEGSSVPIPMKNYLCSISCFQSSSDSTLKKSFFGFAVAIPTFPDVENIILGVAK